MAIVDMPLKTLILTNIGKPDETASVGAPCCGGE